ncbi:MAG: glycosyltransferase family 4 protein [Bdellovibrionales bacterium]|nr:glycosyltransferase family 4 protein [Bdellovibrionales bacterium]
MIRVVHYLTGYFCPARSGIEVAVNNFMQMTAGQTQNYVFTKNAIAKYPNGMRGAPSSSRVDRDYDASTHERLWALKPDLVIVYECEDGNSDQDLMRVFYGKEAGSYGKIARLQFGHRIAPKFMQAADQIWCFDEQVVADIHPKFYEKIHLFPRVFDSAIFHDKVRLDTDPARPKLAYVGRIETRKRVMDLIRATLTIAETHDIHLTIVGGGTPKELAVPVIDAAMKSNSVISYRGFKSQEHAAEVMRRSDIVVIPSTRESFCSVALEALACGCRVVNNTDQDCGLSRWIGGMSYNGYETRLVDQAGVPTYAALLKTMRHAINDLGKLPHDVHNMIQDYEISKVAFKVQKAITPWTGFVLEDPA